MKRVKRLVMIGLVGLVGFTAGSLVNTKASEKVKLTGTDRVGDTKCVMNYSDGSFALVDKENNVFEFFQKDMGDWGYTVNSYDELMNLIATYTDR